MPEHIRALIVILFFSTIVFASGHRPACAISGNKDFVRRRNLWVALTIVAFLSHSFWLYSLIAIPLLLYTAQHEKNIPALFFFLLFVIPENSIKIPGFGLVNHFFEISHLRILELTILLPAFFSLLQRPDSLSFGRTRSDQLLMVYIFIVVVLQLRETTATNLFRHVFYNFIDIFLPYFVISRSLKTLHDFRVALSSLVIAIIIAGLIAVFETTKHWVLYMPVISALGLERPWHGYLERDGILRALSVAGQPIAMGLIMVVGLGFYLFVRKFIANRLIRWSGTLLMIAGLIAPISRGPWVGAVALILVYIATGRHAITRLFGFVAALVIAFSLVAILPGDEKVINLLPFIGKTAQDTIDGRKNLLTNSIKVIQRNPWFGSTDYLETPEMEASRTGVGIIDIVNTYLQIALEVGLVGLSAFIGFFITTLVSIYKAMRTVRNKNAEERLLGQVLFATLTAILVIIFTVSNITFVPIIYWSIAGLGIAYAQMIQKARRETAASVRASVFR